MEWLLSDAFNQAHIEALLILLLHHHLVDAVFEVKAVLLLGVIVERDYPIHQLFHTFVAWVDASITRHVLMRVLMSS